MNPRPDHPLAGYMTPEELGRQLKKSPHTLKRWRVLKKGPPWIKNGNQVLYSRASLDRWLARLETKPQV